MPDHEPDMQALAGQRINLYLSGNSFLMLLVILVCVVVLHLQGPTVERMGSNTDDQPLYGIYGLFWGCVVSSAIGAALLIVRRIQIIELNMASAAPELHYVGMVMASELVIGAMVSLLVAIYFSLRLDFVMISPSIFFWPCERFTCRCCSNNHTCAKVAAKKFVQCFSLWSLVLVIVLLSSHLSFVVLALLARPSTVISTVVMYIFIAAYVVFFGHHIHIHKEKKTSVKGRKCLHCSL